MDESVSLLNHLSAETLSNSRNLVCQLLRGYISGCGWLIALDADMDDRVYNYLKSIRKQEPLVLLNNYKPENPRKFVLTTNYETHVQQIIEDAKKGKKLVLVCMSLQKAIEMKRLLSGIVDPQKIICHTSMSDDILKKSLQTVNSFWLQYDILIYTSVIEAGVDFNVPYYQKMFCFISLGSVTPRAFLQMTGRIRNLEDNIIPVYHDKQMQYTGTNTYLPYLSEIERHIVTNKNCVINNVIYLPNGLMVRHQLYDELTRLFAENYLENYKKTYFFLYTLENLIKSKGHECEKTYMKINPAPIPIPKESENHITISETSSENECLIKLDKDIIENHEISTNISKKQSESEYKEKLLEAVDVTNIDPYLKLKKKGSADQTTKSIIDRYELLRKYKLAPEEFTIEFLDDWLYNGHILENALYVLGKKELDDKGDTYINYTKQRVEYLKKVLDVYKFASIMDRETRVKMTAEIYKRAETTGLLEKVEHDKILRLFNKQIKNRQEKSNKKAKPEPNETSKPTSEVEFPDLKNYTKIFNVILSYFGIKIDNTRKSIMKKGVSKWEYTYYLSDDIYKFTEIISRYN